MIAQSSSAVNFIVFRCLNCKPWQPLPARYASSVVAFTLAHLRHPFAPHTTYDHWAGILVGFWLSLWCCVFAFYFEICSRFDGEFVTPTIVVAVTFCFCHLRHFCTWNAIAMDWAKRVHPLAACAVSWKWFIWARAFASSQRRPHSRAGSWVLLLLVSKTFLIARQLIRVIGHLTPTRCGTPRPKTVHSKSSLERTTAVRVCCFVRSLLELSM